MNAGGPVEEHHARTKARVTDWSFLNPAMCVARKKVIQGGME